MDLYCIKTHPQKLVVAGDIYPCLGTLVCPKCGALKYDVGAKISSGFNQYSQDCSKCGKEYKIHRTCWLSSERFIPIDDISIEEAIECINENELQTV